MERRMEEFERNGRGMKLVWLRRKWGSTFRCLPSLPCCQTRPYFLPSDLLSLALPVRAPPCAAPPSLFPTPFSVRVCASFSSFSFFTWQLPSLNQSSSFAWLHWTIPFLEFVWAFSLVVTCLLHPFLKLCAWIKDEKEHLHKLQYMLAHDAPILSFLFFSSYLNS